MGSTSSIQEANLEQKYYRVFNSANKKDSNAADFGRTLAFGGFFPDRYNDWKSESYKTKSQNDTKASKNGYEHNNGFPKLIILLSNRQSREDFASNNWDTNSNLDLNNFNLYEEYCEFLKWK